jgi:nitric oxide reductase large subunit
MGLLLLVLLPKLLVFIITLSVHIVIGTLIGFLIQVPLVLFITHEAQSAFTHMATFGCWGQVTVGDLV